MAYAVFISYSTHDLPTARVVLQWIQHAGASGFLAEYSTAPGEPLSAMILDAIKQCDLFVLLWSHQAKSSDWVPQEIGVATGLSKSIIPIVMDGQTALPGFIQNLKYLPLYPNPQAAVEWLHKTVVERAKQKQVQSWITAGVLAAIVTALLTGDAKK